MILRIAQMLLAGSALIAGTAWAQDTYPAKPIRWVVGTAAGGGSDVVTRTIAAQISQQMGQTIVVENRPGGGTTIAADAVSRSPADGYTILTADVGTLVFNTALFKQLSYVPSRDLAPVGLLAHVPLVLAVNPNAGFNDAKSAIEAIRAHPGKYSYASAGIGSPHHLSMEFLKDQAKLDMVHIPYKGAAPAVQDAVGGAVPFIVVDSGSGMPMIKAGKLKVLATFTKTRMQALPDTPTLIELGYTKFETASWLSMVVPAATPAPIVARLSTELQKALASAPVQARLRDFAIEAVPTTTAQFSTLLARDADYWPKLIRDKGITLD